MAVENEDIERLKEIFVTRRECDLITDDINHKLSNSGIELAVIKQQLSTITWIAKTTLAAVLTSLVGMVISYIIR